MKSKLFQHTGLLPIFRNNVYYDTKSIEKSTRIKKPKYKLAGHSFLENYFFHVLTTDYDACKKCLTVKIKQSDWEDKVGGHLEERISFCDVRHCESIVKNELLRKIEDPKNGFRYVAKLCSAKCDSIKKLSKKALKRPEISDDTKRIIEQTAIDPKIPLEKLKLI
ncbi:MAG: hypothetical protein JW984_16145 [Deltaproteobacteria bacterium]|uniref:Uncharacterized protein n=1 Tax=Candidatus Zymogenus saltonus TaxID=2844893 RepID=A0A9D8PRH0_9DELT|nr:hypothetical protein [Candidatus Zymogenus saltonus]